MMRLALVLSTLAVVLLPAPAATALSFDPDPVPVSHYGVLAGQYELVGVVTGVPSGGQVLYGSVGGSDTTLVLRASVTLGSSDLAYIGVREAGTLSNWIAFTGLGSIPGDGHDVVGALEGLPGTAGFLPAGGSVGAGEQYDLVFVSYGTALADDGSLEFAGALVLVPDEVGVAAIVPEPGTAALAMLGISLLAVGSGAPRRR